MRSQILSLYCDESREVYLSEMPESRPCQDFDFDLGDEHGYFICEIDKTSSCSGVEILGKTASYEAALRLAEIYLAAALKSSSAPTLPAFCRDHA